MRKKTKWWHNTWSDRKMPRVIRKILDAFNFIFGWFFCNDTVDAAKRVSRQLDKQIKDKEKFKEFSDNLDMIDRNMGYAIVTKHLYILYEKLEKMEKTIKKVK